MGKRDRVMDRLHLGYFTNTYLPVVSGVVRSVSEFRRALTEAGHNVFVFAQHDSKYEDREPFIFRYPSLDLPISVDIPAVIPVSPFIDRILPSLKLDVIHTHHPVLLGQTAAHNAQKLGLPLVFTFHSQYREYSNYVPLPQASIQTFVKNLIDDLLVDFLKLCNHVIVPSESMHKILVEDYGLEDCYSVIPTGIDLSLYQQADGDATRMGMGWQDDKVVISVGRLVQEKNFDTLLEACALAIKSHPELRLVLIGDGPERGVLEGYSRSLGIGANVEFLGKVSFSEVPYYLKAADCFGFASVTETQGLVTLEAIAAGLPVAAVDATGTSDIVRDGREGLMVENDSAALGGAIKSMFDQPDRLRKFGMTARERANSFDIRLQAERLVTVYHQAIEDHKHERFCQVRKVS
jgi:glycosyltransferase involved in cell wall biosynthesis